MTPDINRYWDLRDELSAVIDELMSKGDGFLEEGNHEALNELIARRNAIQDELSELDELLEPVEFFVSDGNDEDALEFDVMDDPDSMDEDLDSDDYDDY
ncbi:hypothetical protein [Eikenella corrodens]|uniref:hypothetical protein n=1 Tax=Eikenella corrodens TaxID=539 RepID=UPI00129B434B|nr:hypothetical protein [Eikenella corrodens]